MGKFLDTGRCKYCKGKIDVNKLLRLPAWNGTNANFCSKKCYIKYCNGLKHKDVRNQAIANYKQRFGMK